MAKPTEIQRRSFDHERFLRFAAVLRAQHETQRRDASLIQGTQRWPRAARRLRTPLEAALPGTVRISPERLGFISIPAGAELVGRSPSTLRRWIAEGLLASATVGGRRLVHRADVQRAALRMSAKLDPPGGWGRFADGTPQPNWADVIRDERNRH